MRHALKAGVVAAAATLLLVSPAEHAHATAPQEAGTAKARIAKARRSAPRQSANRRWRGTGFLPGYRPQIPNSIPLDRTAVAGGYEMRYWHRGQYLYGWGRPRFYRGRWNGGGFGPCWTTTPIGMMWTCGR